MMALVEGLDVTACCQEKRQVADSGHCHARWQAAVGGTDAQCCCGGSEADRRGAGSQYSGPETYSMGGPASRHSQRGGEESEALTRGDDPFIVQQRVSRPC